MEKTAALTVSALTGQIKDLLEGVFPRVWVAGELSNFLHHGSGHMYFNLKDAEAAIRCVMFKGNNQFLRFKPEDGMSVFVNGRVSVYTLRGQYQLVVSQMEPTGIGTLYLAFEALKKQLQEEGLFDDRYKKPLPPIPQRIGLITSKSGAAVQDMLQVLARRAPYVELLLCPTVVQGPAAGGSIAQAIVDMEAVGNVDLIILGRGGGSLEDLWPFNEEQVARAIFACSIPIISAVGHETDLSIADMVADHRASTPSAAAEIAAPSIDELFQRMDTYTATLSTKMVHILQRYAQNTDHLQDHFMRLRPDNLITRLLDQNSHVLSELKQGAVMLLKEYTGRLDRFAGELQMLNPRNILERGYAIATTTDNHILRDPKKLKWGHVFNLQLARGRMQARKEKKSEEKNAPS